ncbi:MAG: bile acid:sodium symporter, partial [Kiritimatiellae bacterium]|nr:bile acid:sodium symporter [Kiritimatiellia bacterium]
FGGHKVFIRRFNSGVILFIVWTAFCQSFLRDVWTQVSGLDVLYTLLGVIVILCAGSSLVWAGSRVVHFPAPSRITAFYCGGQKSIAMGLPLSAMIFSGAGFEMELSLVLMPLLLFHPAQLILGGWLVPRFQRFERESE